MHVLLSVISRSQVETIVQIFAHVRGNHMLLLKSERPSCFSQCPTPGPTFGEAPPLGRRGENAQQKPGGMHVLGIDREITPWKALFYVNCLLNQF